MPASHPLHRAVRLGNLPRVRELLAEGVSVNAYDNDGRAPLMYAVTSPAASVELMRLLLHHGADVSQWSRHRFEEFRTTLSLAVSAGDPQKVALLLENGADITCTWAAGYDVMIDATTGRDVFRDPRLLSLLQLLIAAGAPLAGVSEHRESALSVLSRVGRFDAVRLLLASGAPESYLQWTPLIRAVAIGDLAEVERAAEGAYLEEKDRWGRTAWLAAIQTGDLAKAQLLLSLGADRDTRGHCGKPPLFYAIECHHAAMLRWLLDFGISFESKDDFDTAPLMAAVESGNLEAVDSLLAAGADVHAAGRQTALARARTREIAIHLLDAGADPADLPAEGTRTVLGLSPDPDPDALDVSLEEFRRACTTPVGDTNPELASEPFWVAMIRAGVSAYAAAQAYGRTESPVWCAQRFGQSLTRLPNGSIVQIGGEHEDHYDEDFCIYADVFVHEPDGSIGIYLYPEDDFPPTDFHTATLSGEYIYIIGSVGYQGQRQYGTTPIYRMHADTFRIEPVHASGDAPGWIGRHRAVALSAHQIRISGGKVMAFEAGEETYVENPDSFILDLRELRWSRE